MQKQKFLKVETHYFANRIPFMKTIVVYLNFPRKCSYNLFSGKLFGFKYDRTIDTQLRRYNNMTGYRS